MTGPGDVQQDPTPIVLIDEYEDGYIENHAWVEATTNVPTAEEALRIIEDLYPAGEREEGEGYECNSQQEWLTPDDADAPQVWTIIDPTKVGALSENPEARIFWRIEVVCPV
jgi:hypothetical protein